MSAARYAAATVASRSSVVIFSLAICLWSVSARADSSGVGTRACTPVAPELAQQLSDILNASDSIHDDQIDPNGYTRANGDNDGDGVKNKNDAFPNDKRVHKDSDGDGVGDNLDHFPNDATEWFDSDCDGTGDNSDDTYDGAGIVSSVNWWTGDGNSGTRARFNIVMTPDGVAHIKIKVKLTGRRNAAREAKWEAYVEEIWSNERMTLDLDYVSQNGDVTVSVSRGNGRTNSGHYYTGDSSETIAHETGHLLGLRDEYSSSSDRDRLIGEKDSLMRSHWNDPKIYKRHVDTIVRSFDCDKSRPATTEDIDPEWSDGAGADTAEVTDEDTAAADTDQTDGEAPTSW